MASFKRTILTFITVLVCNFLQAQSAYTDAKRAEYIFYITQRISWKDSVLTDQFRIGVLDTSGSIYNELLRVAGDSKNDSIMARPVRIRLFKSMAQLRKTDVLYVNKAAGFDVNDVYPLTKGTQTLLISDYDLRESMVDLIEVKGQRRYILYQDKLDTEGLTPTASLKAGAIKSREDWEREYYEGRSILVDEQKKVKDFRATIQKQKHEIDSQQQHIDNQKSELTSLLQNVDQQRQLLNDKMQTLQQKEQEITKQNEVLDNQKSSIAEQEEKINRQKSVLNEQLAQIKTQKLLLYLAVAFLFMLLALAFFIYRGYKIKQESNRKLQAANDEIKLRNVEIMQQNEEIEAQRDEIERQRDYVIQQRDLIAEHKEEIMASIHYASRIQTAIQPPPELLGSLLPEYFVLYKPRDIVSGDFYWVTERGSRLFVVAADCTGHGVPGAFMSMLGISFLNQIINRKEDIQAHEVLNQLRELVIKSLRQTGKANESKDGMDISLAIFNYQNSNLQFAGAYNSMYLIRNKELIQVDADKMPIGIYLKMDDFTSKNVEIQPNDTIYMNSDGYVDQLGGPQKRKFMTKRYKETLIQLQDYTMEQQKEYLNNAIETWKGELEQVDDIVVVGVKFKK